MALIASQAQGSGTCPMVRCVHGSASGSPGSGIACEGFEFPAIVNLKCSFV